MAKAATKSSRKRPSKAVSADVRAAQEAARHAPVSLASGGSYDADKLFSGLDKAVDKQGSNRDAEVRKALEGASADAGTNTAAPNQLPNHDTVRAEVQLVAPTEVGKGKDKKTVGGVVVTEFRQVFNADDAGAAGAATPGDAGQGVTGGQSEVLSTEVVRPSAAASPAAAAAVSVPAEDGETGEPGTTSQPDAVEAAIEANG